MEVGGLDWVGEDITHFIKNMMVMVGINLQSSFRRSLFSRLFISFSFRSWRVGNCAWIPAGEASSI